MNATSVRVSLRAGALALALLMVGCGSSEERNAADLLSLSPPVEVVRAEVYADGGTIAVSLQDGAGKALAFFHEGEMRETGHPNGPERLFIRGREVPPGTKRQLYIGGDPNTPDEQLSLIVPGSETDRALLVLLQAWRNRTYSNAEVARMRKAHETGDGLAGDEERIWHKVSNVLGMEALLKGRLSAEDATD